MIYKEQGMKSQRNKRVTSDVARDAVMRSRQVQRRSFTFDRGKTPDESWNRKGVRIRKGEERSLDCCETHQAGRNWTAGVISSECIWRRRPKTVCFRRIPLSRKGRKADDPSAVGESLRSEDGSLRFRNTEGRVSSGVKHKMFRMAKASEIVSPLCTERRYEEDTSGRSYQMGSQD